MNLNVSMAQNQLANYTLLDDIQGPWGFWRNFPANQTVYTVVPSPFPSPAGGLALFQSTIGNSYYGCDVNWFYRDLPLGREYLSGSKLAFFANFNRRCSSCYHDLAGVWIEARRAGRTVKYIVVGNDGGYTFQNWPKLYGFECIPYLNGFSGLIEVTLNTPEPLDSVYVALVNYACVGNNYTILDHVMFQPKLQQEVLSVTARPNILCLDKQGNGSGIVFSATTSAAGTVTFKVRDAINT